MREELDIAGGPADAKRIAAEIEKTGARVIEIQEKGAAGGNPCIVVEAADEKQMRAAFGAAYGADGDKAFDDVRASKKKPE